SRISCVESAGVASPLGAGALAQALSSSAATIIVPRIIPSSKVLISPGKPLQRKPLVRCPSFRVSGAMSEDLTALDATKPKKATDSASQLWIDLGPILVFVVTYNVLFRIEATKAEAIYIATGVFIVSVLAAIAYCK